MQVLNNIINTKPSLNPNELTTDKSNQKNKTDKKPESTDANLTHNIQDKKTNKSKLTLKLEELNKQKVTIDVLDKVVKDIKKDDVNKTDDKDKKNKPSSSIDIKEKEDAKKTDIIDSKDKNKDEKISKEKQTVSLVKEFIKEVKKILKIYQK